MALPDYFKIADSTPLVIKNSGGDAGITLASLANSNSESTGARQAATLDFGALRAMAYRLDVEFELAATPTDGNLIWVYGSWSAATGAGKGGTSGSDAAYTGYSSNITGSLGHLRPLGFHRCTVQATATVQKSNLGVIYPQARYLNVVIWNKSGAAFHSTDTNQVIKFLPIVNSIEDA